MLPECREKSLAMTYLEEAVFWANAAIARNPEAWARLAAIGRGRWNDHDR